jgi:hypothetical protein
MQRKKEGGEFDFVKQSPCISTMLGAFPILSFNSPLSQEVSRSPVFTKGN